MVNWKRDINGYRKELGLYELNYSDLLALEKILRVYSDASEMKTAGIKSLPVGKKHMPRLAVDRYAFMGKYQPFHLKFGLSWFEIVYAGVDWIYREDSVRFLKERNYPHKTRYMELAAWPGIKITFTPRSTKLYAQTHYVTGKELMVMRDVVSRLEAYFYQLPNTRMNLLRLRK